MISVLIATRNRSTQIEDCLRSLLQNTFQDFEILLTDQSTDDLTGKIVKRLHSPKITYIQMNAVGKSKALNQMILQAKNNILAFTDDDCIADTGWLESIASFYKKYPKTAGVFGNTYPYQPEKHPNEVCPATFEAEKVLLFNRPNVLHYLHLGQGNNMSLKKSVIEEVGLNREWLGVGSIAKAGEEGDLVFRILSARHSLMTNPKMVIFHNRYMSEREEKKLQTTYTRGLVAFSSYYFFTKLGRDSFSFVIARCKERVTIFTGTSDYVKRLVAATRMFAKELLFSSQEILAVFQGLFLGVSMAVRDLLSRKLRK